MTDLAACRPIHRSSGPPSVAAELWSLAAIRRMPSEIAQRTTPGSDARLSRKHSVLGGHEAALEDMFGNGVEFVDEVIP